MKQVVHGPQRRTPEHIRSALKRFEQLVTAEAGGLPIPQLCIVELPERIGTAIGIWRIAADIEASGMHDAVGAAEHFRREYQKPGTRIIEGCSASLFIELTRAEENRNITAVIGYSVDDLSDDEDDVLLILMHELQHAMRRSSENLSYSQNEGKADIFALLSLAGRVPDKVLSLHAERTARRTNPLSGSLQRISHDVNEPYVYPLAYLWPLIRPLVDAVSTSGQPLTVKEALTLTDALWNTVIVPSGVEAAAHAAAAKLCLGGRAYGIDEAALSRVREDATTHPVVMKVLNAYAAQAGSLPVCSHPIPDWFFQIDGHSRDCWMSAEDGVNTLMTKVGERALSDSEPTHIAARSALP